MGMPEPALRTLLPPHQQHEPHARLACSILQLAIADSTNPWLNELTRDSARAFLLQPRHYGHKFRSVVAGIDDAALVAHARAVIERADSATTRDMRTQQDDDAAA